MKVLVTGSAGHLGEALVRMLSASTELEIIGLDVKPSPFTHVVGSITDRHLVDRAMADVDRVFHTATLHKPHVATHPKHAFVEVNISGTLNLLEAAAARGVDRFVFTSTTSVFGDALRPSPGEPAAWVTEDTIPIPRNIYGLTKAAAEDLCQLFHRRHGLPCIVLRTSRFFPEADDDRDKRARFTDTNLKAIEFLYRRVEIEDVVNAHLLAADQARDIGFARYIVSATTPFQTEDVPQLNSRAGEVVERRVAEAAEVFEQLGWRLPDQIDRVYDNAAARRDLGWAPRFDFQYILKQVRDGHAMFSDLARAVGAKGYHDQTFDDGPYPVLD